MPVYTCTTVRSMLSADAKAGLAGEITRIHSEVNHVPGTYIIVVFNELAPENVYTDARPAQPLLINGAPRGRNQPTGRRGRGGGFSVTGISSDRVLVVIQNSPAHFAVEGGRVLPAPGEEEAWLKRHSG